MKPRTHEQRLAAAYLYYVVNLEWRWTPDNHATDMREVSTRHGVTPADLTAFALTNKGRRIKRTAARFCDAS